MCERIIMHVRGLSGELLSQQVIVKLYMEREKNERINF